MPFGAKAASKNPPEGRSATSEVAREADKELPAWSAARCLKEDR
jgi:hypothetical protein